MADSTTYLAAVIAASSVGVVCSLVVIVTYFRKRRLRRHPNQLVLLWAVLEAIFSVLFGCIFFRDCGTVSESLAIFSMLWIVVVAQFYYLMLAVDLAVSLDRPFSNPRNRLMAYHAVFGSIIAACALASVDSNARSLACSDGGIDTIAYLFIYVFALIALVLIASGALYLWVKRLIAKLGQSQAAMKKTKQQALRRLRYHIIFMTAYWIIVAAFETVYIVVNVGIAIVYLLPTLWTLAAGGRGVILLGLWLWDGKGSQPLLHFLKELARPDSDDDNNDAAKEDPHLAQALTKETLQYTIRAIQQSLSLAESQAARQSPGAALPSSNTIALSHHIEPRKSIEMTLRSNLLQPHERDDQPEPTEQSGQWSWRKRARAHLAGSTFVTDLHPHLFAAIRRSFAIDSADLAASLHDYHNEQFPPGAIGGFRYYSEDGRFIVKSISSAEYRTVEVMLAAYADYVRANPLTLLAKLLGCYRLRIRHHNMHFVVMANVLGNAPHPIFEQYNLRGVVARKRTVGREEAVCVHCEMSFAVGGRSICPKKGVHVGRRMVVDGDGECGSLRIGTDGERGQLVRDVDFAVEQGLTNYSVVVGVARVDVCGSDDGAGAGTGGGGGEVQLIGVIGIVERWTMWTRVGNWIEGAVGGRDQAEISAVCAADYGSRFKARVIDGWRGADCGGEGGGHV